MEAKVNDMILFRNKIKEIIPEKIQNKMIVFTYSIIKYITFYANYSVQKKTWVFKI